MIEGMEFSIGEVGSGEEKRTERRHGKGELFIEVERAEDCEEEQPEEVETWGVYFQGSEKTLLGLFWDQELANIFMESVRNTNVLQKVKEIS